MQTNATGSLHKPAFPAHHPHDLRLAARAMATSNRTKGPKT